jgi:hypothetical protein
LAWLQRAGVLHRGEGYRSWLYLAIDLDANPALNPKRLLPGSGVVADGAGLSVRMRAEIG